MLQRLGVASTRNHPLTLRSANCTRSVMPNAKSQTLSLGLHATVVALLLLLGTRSIQTLPAVAPAHTITVAPLSRLMAKWTGEKSGGGNQTLLPARHGAPPPKATRVFVPPTRVPDPKLAMPVSVAFESPVILMSVDQIGDPLSKLPNGGLGMHGKNSIGDSSRCCGIGDGHGGPDGISVSRPGHPVIAPVLIYKVEPEFSEEARKAKYSGIVVLAIEVDISGHPRNFRVIQGAGLGLEQKAIDAVKQWRFRPGYQDGKPVVTAAQVEVTFRLM